MEPFYIFIVIVLFGLAISDLIVGVSNDAVNFLNSAIGSKAAPFKVIMLVAALGILAGATFSNGMMEIARKGIFHPDQFYFSEIMIIFLAVMMAVIILLDVFNTFGLPTSTTVSIVFALLGAAVAVSIIKISTSPERIQDLSNYINSGKALAIILGILLSVIIAFTLGAIVQYIIRIIFSFEYTKSLKYFGSIWGGLVISAITFFLLIKGAKGSSFITIEILHWIKANTLIILALSFIFWTILLQLLSWIFKINILKFIVLVGTFALAMAFAGNDLVNFIGVPLAGFESFKSFIAEGIGNPDVYSMEALKAPIQTPPHFLLIAGIIMVVTLWFSKKARSVTQTTLDLSRQEEGPERFESSYFARSIVRNTISISNTLKVIVPRSIQVKVNKRFNRKFYNQRKKEQSISFDMLRASVNLFLASILIAMGTSLKLPLSTTYVTFMVIMGTSLADRAWGRESAVNRITGVITVISGWFFTALSAFTVAFLMALIIHWTGFIGIILLILLVLFTVIKTRDVHKKRDEEEQKIKESYYADEELKSENILETCKKDVSETISSISKLFSNTYTGLIKEDRKSLKSTLKEIKLLNKKTKTLKDNIYNTIKRLEDDSIETGPYYVQVLDYLREAAHCLTYLSEPIFNHIDNNHPPLRTIQKNALKELNEQVFILYKKMLKIIKDDKFKNLGAILNNQKTILDKIEKLRKRQIKMIKREEAGTKNSLLFLNTLTESKNLVLNSINILKAQRDFVNYSKNNKKELYNPDQEKQIEQGTLEF